MLTFELPPERHHQTLLWSFRGKRRNVNTTWLIRPPVWLMGRPEPLDAPADRTQTMNSSRLDCQLFHCPVTDQQVLADKWQQIAIPGGWVVWWHCSACVDWHAITTDTHNHCMRTHSEEETARVKHLITRITTTFSALFGLLIAALPLRHHPGARQGGNRHRSCCSQCAQWPRCRVCGDWQIV